MIPKDIGLPTYLSPSTPIFMQIKSHVSSLAQKKVTKYLKNELLMLVNNSGWEAEKFMFICLLQQIELKEIKEKATLPKVTLLAQLLSYLSTRYNFLFYFPDVLTAAGKNPSYYLQALFKYLKLQIQSQIIMSLSMYLSETPQNSKEGQILLKNKLNEYYNMNRPVEFPPKIMEELLFQISRNPQLLEDMHDEYQYLLDTSSPDRIPQTRCYHYLNDNYKVYGYEAPPISKTSELIKKSELLKDLGPYCTFNGESLKVVLNELGPLTEEDVFECLMVMADAGLYVGDSIDRFMTDLLVANKKSLKAEDWRKFYQNQDLSEKKMQASWNVDIFLQHAVQTVQHLKWTNVMPHFDRPNLEFTSPYQFMNMFKFFQKAKKQGPKFKTPEVLFFKKWNNPRSQLTFLTHVFKCYQPDIFCLSEIGNKKTAKWLTESLKSNATQYPLQTQLWGYLDMVQLLVYLSEYDFMTVRELFYVPMRTPYLLIQTLSYLRTSRGDALLDEIFSNIFPIYLSNHTSYVRLLETLWENNEYLVISSICYLYKNENKKYNSCLNLSRVLDITQNVRYSLIPLSFWNDYGFAVSLGILAGKRYFLHFEQWIKERLKLIGAPFLNAILNYVEDHLLKNIRELNNKIGSANTNFPPNLDINLEKAQLSRYLLAYIFESALQISGNKFTIRTVENLKRLYKEICQYFPEMSESQMPDEIETKAEREFHRIYKYEMSLQDAIQLMTRLKNSTKQEERELYASMITFLFTELRFHSNYPERELMITANFFSEIINANLIDKKLINVFLQVLKDDLKLSNKKYDFAVTVVDKIKGKLTDEPDFCYNLLENYNFLSRNPELVSQLLNGLTTPLQLSPEKSAMLKSALEAKMQPKLPPPVVVYKPVVPTETDLDLLETEDKSRRSQGGEKERKLIHFLNNLTMDYINEKHKEFDKLLDSKELVKWLSYHIVFKRLTTLGQPNAFEIYVCLLNRVNKLEKPIVKLTYKILDKWFKLTGKSVNDSKLKQFKNIGYWLGRVTIARNEPILINRLNLKEILINSYQKKSRLQLNVDVISKILEARKDSKIIFCLKNAWLCPIISVMKELQEKVYDNQVKTEVQRLFRTIQIEEGDIPESEYLSCPVFHNEGKPALTILELPNFVQINEYELGQYTNNKGIDLRKIIAQSVDSAIQEIVPPVIARSVTIALVTTKQIALKDFVLEPDDRKVTRGLHLIVQNLAGSLALVTCREPLKMSLTNYLKKRLEDYPFLSEHDKEVIINAASRDNLDLGCALIKKAVIYKALEDINKDSAINEQLEKRRESMSKNYIFRNDEFLSPLVEGIPEQLRPKIGGLSDYELRIYEDFQKDKRSSAPTPSISSLGDTPKYRQDRLMTAIRDNESLSIVADIASKGSFNYTYVAQKTQQMLVDNYDNAKYYTEVLKLFKEYVKPEEMFSHFNEIIQTKKDFYQIVSELSTMGYFPRTALQDYLKKHKIQYYNDAKAEEKAIQSLEEWMGYSDIEILLSKLSLRLNKSEDYIKKFFYFTLKYATEKALEGQSNNCESLDYRYIDQYSKLIIMLLKILTENRGVYLEHVCYAILMVINRFHEFDSRPFNQRPFFKLILNLIYDVSRTSYEFDQMVILTMYTVFAQLLHKLNPIAYPGFSFAWLELISNKYFMPTILNSDHLWDLYHELLLDALKLAHDKITLESLNSYDYMKVYYKGIVRLVTVLLHDFPDFLSYFSLSLCNQTADRFIQLRNMILSAFPKNIKFAEPQNLNPDTAELDSIENSKKLPKYYKLKFSKSYDLIGVLKNEEKTEQLKQRLEKETSNGINSFVLYMAWSIYEADQSKQSALEEEFSRLLTVLLSKADMALKLSLIRGILNQIRFPNLITVFFIKLVSRVFYEYNDSTAQSLLVKGIMERMKVEKPHPWGLIFVTNQMKQLKKRLLHLNLPEISEL